MNQQIILLYLKEVSTYACGVSCAQTRKSGHLSSEKDREICYFAALLLCI